MKQFFFRATEILKQKQLHCSWTIYRMCYLIKKSVDNDCPLWKRLAGLPLNHLQLMKLQLI